MYRLCNAVQGCVRHSDLLSECAKGAPICGCGDECNELVKVRVSTFVSFIQNCSIHSEYCITRESVGTTGNYGGWRARERLKSEIIVRVSC